MTNFQVYKKTLSFSLLLFLVDLLVLAVIGDATYLGFYISAESTTEPGLAIAGLAIGFLLGIIIAILIKVFITNRIKAAQVAMMAKGVTSEELSEHTFSAGFEEVKGRFGSITAFFFVTGVIRSVFRQIGRSINRIGTAVGGQTGDSITSLINSAIQTLVGYLCDCCLGWIMFRKDERTAKAGCEGAVIFFRSGKTLFRNIGRIFGLGILSFIIIGGGLFGLGYLIFSQFPGMFDSLLVELRELMVDESGAYPEFLNDATSLMISVSVLVAVFLWSTLHSVLVRPFILVGVMRNFMKAGLEKMPTDAEFEEVAQKAPKLRKLQNSNY